MASAMSLEDNHHKQAATSNSNTRNRPLPPLPEHGQQVVYAGDDVCTCSDDGTLDGEWIQVHADGVTYLQRNERNQGQEPVPEQGQQVVYAGDDVCTCSDDGTLDGECIQLLTDGVTYLQVHERNQRQHLLVDEYGCGDRQPLVNRRPQDSSKWSQKCIAVLILLVVISVLVVTILGVLSAITAHSTTTTTAATTTITTTATATKTAATATTTAATTTTATPTSTEAPLPSECVKAINFTQSWRMDHNGSDQRPGGPHSVLGYACDPLGMSYWFRFTGEAGNRMLDSCPKMLSCGTKYPLWTDNPMPSTIGEKKKVIVHGVDVDGCKQLKRPIHVMRCSWETEYDYVYHSIDYSDISVIEFCNFAFCGMK